MENFKNLQVGVEKIKKSYISKEKFIEMLNSMDFVAIKYCNIDFLTGIIGDGKTGEIKELGYNIILNQQYITRYKNFNDKL